MIVIGHRGAKGLAPENTLRAFAKALEHNVAEIEFDVRVTKDGVPVLLHDHAASDASGNSLEVATSSYDDLKKHKPDLVTLREAIDFVDGKVPLLIETKPNVPTGPIIKVLRQYLDDGWPADRFLIQSFSQSVLRELHAGLPEIEPVVLEVFSGVRAHWRAHQVGAKRIVMWHKVLYSWYIRVSRRSGYRLTAWTLNDPKKAKRWDRAGLYGVITDFPDRFES